MSHSQPGGMEGGMPPQTKAPYIPTTWGLGGVNKRNPDLPVSCVFLVLFVLGAVTHMTIFQLNKRRGHKFLFSGLLFGFCMARITTMVMRIASICLPHNISIAIAAQVFLNAGVVILFIVNLVFAQRVFRAAQPHIGWNPIFSTFIKACFALIIISIAMLITAVVQTFYTLNKNTRRIDRDIQLYGVTYFTFVSFLPIPLTLIAILLPRPRGVQLDKFGHGRFREKIIILLTAATLICVGACYRAYTSWHHPVPRTEPMPASFAKAALYVVDFTVEIIVVYMYAIVRVDLRFHVPNGAHGPGSYRRGAAEQAMAKDEVTEDGVEYKGDPESVLPEHVVDPADHRIFTEEEMLDNDARLDLGPAHQGVTRPAGSGHAL